MSYDSLEIEEQYDVVVVEQPESANHLYDSTENQFHQINGWKEHPDAYHIAISNGETVTVRKYLHPTNRYYLTKSSTYADNR